MSSLFTEISLRQLSAFIATVPFCFFSLAVDAYAADAGIWGAVERPDESEVAMNEEVLGGVSFGGRAELSYQQLRRATEQEILNTRILLGFGKGNWGHAVEARANQGKEGETTTAERYQLNFKSEYEIDDNDYVFAAVNSEKNRIDNIQLRTVEAVGYGRRLLRSDRQQLDTEIGIGARQVRFRDETPRETSEIIRLGLDYDLKISDSARFSQVIQVDRAIDSEENTRSESITSLSASLLGELALTVSLELVHNSVPGSDTIPRTQTTTSVGLSYNF
jgi:putative salt-induced outer membrane protein